MNHAQRSGSSPALAQRAGRVIAFDESRRKSSIRNRRRATQKFLIGRLDWIAVAVFGLSL